MIGTSFCSKSIPKVDIAEGSAEGSCGRLKFRGRFFFDVSSKSTSSFAEGSAEGFFGSLPQDQLFLMCRVPRKVFAEGSAEGSRKVFRGRFKIFFET